MQPLANRSTGDYKFYNVGLARPCRNVSPEVHRVDGKVDLKKNIVCHCC